MDNTEENKRLAKLTFDVLRNVFIDREPLNVSDEVKQERIQICRECNFLDSETMRCRHNGTFIKEQTDSSLSVCPTNKWGQSDVDWINTGFNRVLETINAKTEDHYKSPNYLPLEPKIGEEAEWENQTFKWNGDNWVVIK